MQSRDHNSLNISDPHARVLYTGEEQMLKRQINGWRWIVCVLAGMCVWFCACWWQIWVMSLKTIWIWKIILPILNVNTHRCFIAEWSCQSFLVCIIAANKHLSIWLKHILIRQQRRYVMREYVMVSPRNDTCILCIFILSWRTSMAILFEFLNRLETCSTDTCSNTNTWLDTPWKLWCFFFSLPHTKKHKHPHCMDEHIETTAQRFSAFLSPTMFKRAQGTKIITFHDFRHLGDVWWLFQV